jgi:hypothetical protein
VRAVALAGAAVLAAVLVTPGERALVREAHGPRWAPGTRTTYRVDWATHGATTLGVAGQALAASVRLRGELVVDCFESRGGLSLLAASLGSIEDAGLDVAGKLLVAREGAALALEGVRALFEVDERGTIRRVVYENDRSGIGQYVLRALLLHLNLTAPPPTAGTASVEEWGPSGRAIARYARSPGDPRRIERVRLSYTTLYAAPGLSEGAPRQRLRSRSEIELGARGWLRSIVDDEVFTAGGPGEAEVAATARFALRLRARGPLPDRRAPALEGSAELSQLPPPRLTRDLLRQRVDGLTWERVEKDLRLHDAAGFVVQQHRWFWRATGLLELEPALSVKLLAEFRRPLVSKKTRAFILDLLSGVGHREAQVALRAALGSAEAQGDAPAFAELLQRFAFVQRPEPESIAFVQALLEADVARTAPPVRRAILFTLGSLAGNARREHPGAADALHGWLRASLRGAMIGSDREALLAALGNAGFVEDAPLVSAYAQDPDPHVRLQVSWSMRSMPREPAVETLLSLLTDREMMLQVEALRQLALRPLFEVDLVRLEEVVARRHFSPEAYVYLLDLLAGYRGGAVARILEQVGRDDAVEERVRVRSRKMLETMKEDLGRDAPPDTVFPRGRSG